jgi:uncharacterized phage-associated protein
MRPVIATTFDVAIWFLERARAEDTYLQPRKLQSLLFLAQAHYAAGYNGRRLMPSVFVFDDGGPMDPNVYRAFENGRPIYTGTPIGEAELAFLDAVWRRYRTADALRLDQVIASHGQGEPAIQRRDGSEITLAAMRRMFGADRKTGRSAPASAPRVMRSHTGRKVTVKKWTPARKVVHS